MSSVEQNEIDKLLSKLQEAGPNAAAPAAAVAPAPADPTADVGGTMEAPGAAPAQPGLGGPAVAPDAGLAGDFDPPPLAPPQEAMAANASEFQRLLAIEVPLIVLLGQRRMNVGEVMRLAVGAIIEFNKSADEEMELLVNNKSVGQGTAVKVGENFGIKVTSIGPVRETIRKLGAA